MLEAVGSGSVVWRTGELGRTELTLENIPSSVRLGEIGRPEFTLDMLPSARLGEMGRPEFIRDIPPSGGEASELIPP